MCEGAERTHRGEGEEEEGCEVGGSAVELGVLRAVGCMVPPQKEAKPPFLSRIPHAAKHPACLSPLRTRLRSMTIMLCQKSMDQVATKLSRACGDGLFWAACVHQCIGNAKHPP